MDTVRAIHEPSAPRTVAINIRQETTYIAKRKLNKPVRSSRVERLTVAFDTVFRSESVKIILTPTRAPNANSVAERWVRSVRTESLDKLLIVNQRHLRSVLSEYVDYYNTARPHQGIDFQTPIHQSTHSRDGPIQCHNILEGIIRDYYRKAA